MTRLVFGVHVVHYYHNGQISTCESLRPGECCRTIPPELVIRPQPPYPLLVIVDGLLTLDIAAIWEASEGQNGCSGVPSYTTVGPGTVRRLNSDIPYSKFTGASYVRLPPRLPPDEKASAWLSAEGMLGLVWGDGSWLAAGWSGIKKKRGIISSQHGTAYCRPPLRGTYPDAVTVGSVEYRKSNSSQLEYRSAEGQLLGD
ncbi:MAG: hypothetical protein Q9228_002814 [Teloschistes exilis]